MHVCDVGVKSHKCFPWLLRHRKRGSGTLCGNILWLKVVFLSDGGGGGVSFTSRSFYRCGAGDTLKD